MSPAPTVHLPDGTDQGSFLCGEWPAVDFIDEQAQVVAGPRHGWRWAEAQGRACEECKRIADVVSKARRT